MNFIKYPSIRGLHKVPSILNEELIVTEKLHGCLKHSTKIQMADGSKKLISSIVVGDEVLGMKDGIIIPSKVTQKFLNGTTKSWLSITGTRRGVGRGSSDFAIHCTTEHRFWDPISLTFKFAKDLKIDDKILMLRSHLDLNEIQEQVLLGKLLGDGSLSTKGFTSFVSFSHREEDRDYVNWTAQALGSLMTPAEGIITSGFGTKMVRRTTASSFFIKQKFQSMYDSNNKKFIPDWIADEITPIALAFWYMDDGSLGHSDDGSEDKANFATNSFTQKDCEVLAKGLKKFNIDSVIYEKGPYLSIRLNSDDAEKFFLLVAPYIPPAMQRKLPSRYRGSQGWLPGTIEYKPRLVTQVIKEIKTVVAKHKEKVKHDIETETNNYFANGILVHNSNVRIAYTEKKGLLLGSRETVLYSDGEQLGSLSSFVPWALENKIEERLKNSPYHNHLFFGEFFGKGVQKGVSYSEEKDVRIFDIYSPEEKFLDYDEVLKICAELNFLTPPIIAEGIVTMEYLNSIRDNISVVGAAAGYTDANNIWEGVVLKPKKMKKDHHDEWLFAKFKSAKWAENAEHTPTKHINTEKLDQAQKAHFFAESVVTDGRMNTILDHIKRNGNEEVSMKRTGDFLKEMIKDVAEEHAELFSAMDSSERGAYNKAISERALPKWKELIGK